MIYTDHFGLAELPFGLTPDTSFLFASAHARKALNTLLLAVRSGEGFIKITGEVGTGKTLLCRQFMKMLDDGFVTAYIPNPLLEPRMMLLALADDLGIVLETDMDQHRLLKAISRHLILLGQQGKSALLCLDEAQTIPLDTLETLRLLTNLETEKRKWLQIVLFGQPELNRTLALDSARQLNQRITFHHHIEPLSRDDIEYYVAHRLRIAGFAGSRLFSKAAIGRLYSASGGIPRLINIIAHKSLMLSYGEGMQQVVRRHVHGAARDTLAGARYYLLWFWLLLAACALAGIASWIVTR
jgi:MSHA biogenesis protein MshM